MLVLNCKQHESIVIDERIVVTVVEVKGVYKVRLGIEADRDVSIYKQELYVAICQERLLRSYRVANIDPRSRGAKGRLVMYLRKKGLSEEIPAVLGGKKEVPPE